MQGPHSKSILLWAGTLALVAGVVLFGARIYYAKTKLQAVDSPSIQFEKTQQFNKIEHTSKKLLVLFGDSRMSRWDPLPDVPGYTVVNRGRGGDTTPGMLTRFNNDVAILKPSIIVIQGGINDIVAAGLNPDADQRVKANAASNLHKIAKMAEATGAKVILMKVIPPSEVGFLRQFFWSDRIPVLTKELNDMLPSRSLDSTSALQTSHGAWKTGVNADELHLTAKGYELLNMTLQQTLGN